jgi:uncharacterized membrane protein
MNVFLVLTAALLIAFASGLRAFTPVALVSWLAIWGWMPLAGSPLWFLGTTACAIILSIFAVGELIGDKLPVTPPRIQFAPLAARVITGTVSAAALCFAGGKPWFLGIIPGVVGTVAGAFGGYHARRSIVQRLRVRDWLIALVEDGVVIVTTLLVIKYFFGMPAIST